MQLIEEKRRTSRRKSYGTNPPLFFSISRPDQPGIINLVNIKPVKFEKKHTIEVLFDFSSWSMPEQEDGVIKSRDHDFW